MTAMLPPHYDVAAAQSLASLYEHSHPAASAQHQAAHHASNIPHKPKLIFKMPRVVPDQKHKFENDELFRRLSRDSEVRTILGTQNYGHELDVQALVSKSYFVILYGFSRITNDGFLQLS